MCIVFAAFQSHPRYPLIIAANRDEFYGRPTKSAHFWEDEPNVLAGRDLEQMGTWMGITKSGKIAALTNYRDMAEEKENKRSRGNIVREYLTNDLDPEPYLSRIQRERMKYRGFNVLAGNQDKLLYYSNIEDKIKVLQPGVYGLSNHLLNTPWPKVDKGKQILDAIVTNEHIDKEDLFHMLSDVEQAPIEKLPSTGVPLEMEKMLSSIFIKSANYGTRCSTVVMIDNNGVVDFTERNFQPVKEPDRHFQFQIEE